MRPIDADEMALDELEAHISAQLKTKDRATMLINEVVHKKIQMLIADTPTIDAVPVVRCGECELRECEGRSGTIVCGKDGNSHKPDWFCADGERRAKDGHCV